MTALSSSLLQTLEREDENKGRQTLKARRSASYSEKSLQVRRASSKSIGHEGGAGGPSWITDFSQALEQAVASDRPVFVTRRPQELDKKLLPSPGESFAFRGSFILPQTSVLAKYKGRLGGSAATP